MAGAAPGGPEIEDETSSLGVFKRESRAFGNFPEREIRGLAGVGVFLRFDGEGSLRDFIESEQQVLAQADIRAMRKAPDVTQFLTNLTAAGSSRCCIGECEGTGVLLDRAIRIFF